MELVTAPEPAARSRADDLDEPAPGLLDRLALRLVRYGWPSIITAVVVVASCALIASVLHPPLIFRDTTPTGGDLGAHVWSPAYLRDHLLPHFRLQGWTHDWYAGFPAFQFYMIVPSLLIVLLDVGLPPVLAVPVVLAAAAAAWFAWRDDRAWPYRKWVLAAAIAVVVLSVGLPYGVAMKVVVVSGLVTMPLNAYLLGRFSGLAFPLPALLSVSTLPFVFDRSFNIYGGNIASTMAGEFAFSIALSLSLLYLGVLFKSLATGRHRGWAALLFALVALCHLLVAFFAIAVTVIALLVRLGRSQLRTVVFIGITGGLLTAFWVLPFYLKRIYVNDMGWVKLGNFKSYLLTRDTLNPAEVLRDSPPFEVVFALALLGGVMTIVKRNRLGLVLAISAAVVALAFIHLPQGRLWNGRIVPYYYLCMYMLAAIGVGEFLTSFAAALKSDRLGGVIKQASPAVAFCCMWLVFGPSLRALPGGETDSSGMYKWPAAFPLISTRDTSFLQGWAEWNFRGYEEKGPRNDYGGYPEYYAIMQTMARVGDEQGCGRALWEYDAGQEAYGTTMAMMLLPHWTNGCIASMEGLYFEASSTTPFHFITQSALSQRPSRAQSHIPYPNFDLDLGVQQLQLIGVRYFMTVNDATYQQAREHPDLREIASSGPWHVFLVSDSELVTPLANEPVVYEGISERQDEWLPRAADFYSNPEQWDVMRVASGPRDWARYVPCEIVPDTRETTPVLEDCPQPTATPLTAVSVSDIEVDDDALRFRVDRPGVPVLVKMSYFPNWKVEGGTGPYRVAPNLMVVVPTSNEVRLHYGYTGSDLLSYLLTAMGLVALVVLFRRPPALVTAPWFDPLARVGRRRREAVGAPAETRVVWAEPALAGGDAAPVERDEGPLDEPHDGAAADHDDPAPGSGSHGP